MSKSKPPTSSPDVSATPATPHGPKIIFPLGRGAHGKTFWARWAIERANLKGRSVTVADADRTNATLSKYFPEVERPAYADNAAMEKWFESFSQKVITSRSTAVLDLGGGDQLLKELSRDFSVVSLFEEKGIKVVAVHLLGPELDDLSYLREVEDNGLFAPAATILVLNEGLVPSESPLDEAFKPLRAHETFRAAVDRGAQPILMPRLKSAYELSDRELRFAQAQEDQGRGGQPALSFVAKQRVTTWLRIMEQNFEDVSGLLP